MPYKDDFRDEINPGQDDNVSDNRYWYWLGQLSFRVNPFYGWIVWYRYDFLTLLL